MKYTVRGGCTCPLDEQTYLEGEEVELTNEQHYPRRHLVEAVAKGSKSKAKGAADESTAA